MTISGFQIAFYTITFLLPGYIASYVMGLQRSRLRNESQLEFIRWLALSTLCLAPVAALLFALAGGRFTSQHEVWIFAIRHRWYAALIWLATVLLLPVVVGKLLAWSQANPKGILRYFVTKHPQSHDTAWDARFASIDNKAGDWVMVFLTDGGWLAGRLQEGSHASIDPEHRDLYISLVDYTSVDEDFTGLTRPGGGVYIPAARIRFIRFWA
ncbi:MAG TPA: DUF6338 family protein [Thermomicrobiaceae bacterium]|nr:DUF6338 family protein [Thermomicrobiaceae bacterium]